MIKYLTQCLVEYAQIINENGEINEYTVNRESKAEKELEAALEKYIIEKTPKYFTTTLKLQLKDDVQAGPSYTTTVNVDQLVMAPDKESARKAVEDACKNEYPKGIILEIRVNDTLIGK